MSPRILRTTRRLHKETVQVEVFVALDGQGKPTYDPPQPVKANVVRSEKFVVIGEGGTGVASGAGSRIRTPVTLYVQGDEDPLPGEQDRITLDEGTVLIGVERTEPRGLRASRDDLDHVRLRCRLGT